MWKHSTWNVSYLLSQWKGKKSLLTKLNLYFILNHIMWVLSFVMQNNTASAGMTRRNTYVCSDRNNTDRLSVIPNGKEDRWADLISSQKKICKLSQCFLVKINWLNAKISVSPQGIWRWEYPLSHFLNFFTFFSHLLYFFFFFCVFIC